MRNLNYCLTHTIISNKWSGSFPNLFWVRRRQLEFEVFESQKLVDVDIFFLGKCCDIIEQLDLERIQKWIPIFNRSKVTCYLRCVSPISYIFIIIDKLKLYDIMEINIANSLNIREWKRLNVNNSIYFSDFLVWKIKETSLLIKKKKRLCMRFVPQSNSGLAND